MPKRGLLKHGELRLKTRASWSRNRFLSLLTHEDKSPKCLDELVYLRALGRTENDDDREKACQCLLSTDGALGVYVTNV